MSKVIRISDGIFKRLQDHGTPLVDTPASVIERLLDYYEANRSTEQDTRVTQSEPPSGANTLRPEGFYLAPGNLENMEATVLQSYPTSQARSNVSWDDYSCLQGILEEADEFRCWGMTKNSRSKFTPMEVGDWILFTLRGTGRFSYSARVIGKMESKRLAALVWPVQGDLPWELMYFLDDVNEIDISKEKVLAALGYASNFAVQGITRVSAARVENAIGDAGSIARLIDGADLR